MKNILNLKQAKAILPKLNKKKVLAGGCFDLLHLGHITFLEKSRKKGDIQIILLESDQTIKKIKGQNRPINDQLTRAKILVSLRSVDFVVLLPPVNSNKQYDQIVASIKPDFLTTTKGDPNIIHKKRQATLTGAKIAIVTDKIDNQSTTGLSKLILDNFKG